MSRAVEARNERQPRTIIVSSGGRRRLVVYLGAYPLDVGRLERNFLQNWRTLRDIEELERQNALLRAELWEQWELNHSEYCGHQWPHPDGRRCYYPLPSALVVKLASEALQLQPGEGDRSG